MTFIETCSKIKPQARQLSCMRRPETFGYLPNFTRAFSLDPRYTQRGVELNGEIKSGMDCAATSWRHRCRPPLRSSYCTLAHGSVLVEKFLEPERGHSLLADHRTAELSATEVAVMDLAAKVADDATSIQQADIDHCRSVGLTDADILDVVLAASARCFFSKTLDALGVEPDAKYAELDPALRDALTVGRAIALP